jgi:DNA polymerase II large subunit
MSKVKFSVEVQCNECGKKFTTRNICPTCPKCGGSDAEPIV